MKRRLIAAALASGLASLAGCASAPTEQEAGRFYWMVGCWKSADGVNTETWSRSEGGVMFGYATTMKAGQLDFFEQARIELRRGRAIYTTSPGGQRPIDFFEPPAKPVTLAKGEKPPLPSIRFENPDHDYPQAITYRQTKDGLAATVSLLDGSRPTEYAWQRCKN